MNQTPPLILLKTVEDDREQRSWNFSASFEIGRSEQVDLTLRDVSVSRRHAEIFWKEDRWQLRDLGSRNGTFLNGVRLEGDSLPIRSGDQIGIGVVKLQAEIQHLIEGDGAVLVSPTAEDMLETVAHASLEKILKGLTGDSKQQSKTENKLFALFRAAFHLGSHQNEAELISSILAESLQVLDAQRGALVLVNGAGELELRAAQTANGFRPGDFPFSRNMARRCLQEGMSILCSRSSLDHELRNAKSVVIGEMNSILCVLLRTPRKRLGVLHLDRNPFLPPFTYEDLQMADALAASVSAGLESAQLLRQQQEWFLGTLTTLVQAVELRDPYTAGHAQRVTQFSLMLARQLNLSPVDLHWIKTGTPLHDIGKIGISDNILNKPSALTNEEFAIIQTHPEKGEEMLKNLANLAPILPIVRSHHERWDGRGYPDGLVGEETALLARIVAVADTFDAITTDRPYRKGLSFARAAEEIRQGSGTQFDPICAEAFFDIRSLLEEEALGRNRDLKETPITSPLKETKRFRLPTHIPTLNVT